MEKIYLLICLLGAVAAHGQDARKIQYVNHTEVGGMFGRVKYFAPNTLSGKEVDSKASLTAQTFNGIVIGNKLAAGVTLGMDWYKAALLNPIAGGVRYDLLGRKNVRLYGTLDAGYGFAWFHSDSDGFDTKGGLMLNPGMGLKVGRTGAAAFTLAFTYKRQEAHVTKVPFPDQKERFEDRVYNRLALRLGIVF